MSSHNTGSGRVWRAILPNQGLEDKHILGLIIQRKQENDTNLWLWDPRVPLPRDFQLVEKVATEGPVL